MACNFPFCCLSFFKYCEAILVESEIEFLKSSLLIIVDRCFSIMFADIFATFSGISFDPFAFLASKREIIFLSGQL